jgi:hypothetical protein
MESGGEEGLDTAMKVTEPARHPSGPKVRAP